MPAGEWPLLRTKLDLPLTRTHTLARDRLLALVSSSPGTRLVLLSAPAGFGKTTFLGRWCHELAQAGAAVAWLALDESDNEPARFLAYLQASIACAMEPLGEASGLDQAWPAAADSAATLTWLINALAALDHDLVLVLDGYHLIASPAIHSAVAFLLDHLPDRVCLAIGSRADPPLQLARLRAREQLIELRATQLRFTSEEIQAFFQLVNRRALTSDEARAISVYTEGWPAGVQLVALALRSEAQEQAAEAGAAPGPPFRQIFDRLDASQQHIFAYLADDVFEQQPPRLKAFLLQTAILDQMCAPLCDAVLGLEPKDVGRGEAAVPPMPQARGHADSYSRLLLEELERANLFVIPLDHGRRWYRYHHLFQAFLRERLDCEPPAALAELHRRASAWLEGQQLLPGAVQHALAAGDLGHATELIEQLRATANCPGDELGMRAGLARSDAPVEALSERELEVLRLIAGGASNQAIAAALVISLGTVKSHTNHILGKLGAHNRTEAVARARDLQLLAG